MYIVLALSLASITQISSQALSCHNLMNVSLGEDCTASISPQLVLTDSEPLQNYSVMLLDEKGDLIPGNIVDINQLWTTVTVKITQVNNGNSCWSYLNIEDKNKPTIDCSNYASVCFEVNEIEPLHSDNCGFSELVILNRQVENLDCDALYSKRIVTTYAAEDSSGNRSDPCEQVVLINRLDPDLIEFPESFELSVGTELVCSEVSFDENGFPNTEDTGVPEYLDYPLIPTDYLCHFVVEYEDILLNADGCGKKFMRTWKVYQEECGMFEVTTEVQTIEIEDTQSPLIYCPDSKTVNTDGSPGCDVSLILELAEYEDDCTEVIEMDIQTPLQFLNNIDTMPTVNLNTGVNAIVYTVYDNCDNSATCTSVITVLDNAPPTPRCDNSSVVSLRSNGTANAPASSFDEGSFDDCDLYKILVRRDNQNCDCPLPQFDDMEFFGEYESHYYYVSTIRRYGFEAFEYAKAMGGEILTTETIQEHSWVYDQLNEELDTAYLLGLKDKDTTGIFRWYDHSLPGFELWEAGFPGDDIYVVVNDDGNWETVKADEQRYYFVMELSDLCGFSNRVFFCCEDAGSNVPMILRAVDRSGRFNDCEFSTEIQDKVAPVIQCPPNMVLECNTEIDTNSLEIYGMATATDQCFADINSSFEYNVNNCGIGEISRQFIASDANGESSCTQSIILEYSGAAIELEIIWPEDYDSDAGCADSGLEPKNLPDGFDYPDFEFVECADFQASYHDDIYSFSGSDACFKILRNWTVIDLCREDEPNYEGFQYQQTIKVSNISGPDIISGCDDITINIDDCVEADVNLSFTASDDCTPGESLINSIQVDVDSDGMGNFDISDSGSGAVITMDTELPIGEHFALVNYRDMCGNSSSCSKVIVVNSTTGPEAICVGGLSTVIQNMDTNGDGNIDVQMASVMAHNLDAANASLQVSGSNHPCGAEFYFSFSEDSTDLIRFFDCDDVDQSFELELWVTDEFGNTSVCTSIVEIMDTEMRCSGNQKATFGIYGDVSKINGQKIENVGVQVLDSDLPQQMTQSDGSYAFEKLPAEAYYSLAAFKKDNPLEGVSTLDILMIQRHILGLEYFDKAYKYVAADVDMDGRVSARDLIELRKLILGINENFEQDKSWRFFSSEHQLNTPADNYPKALVENYEIYSLKSDMEIAFSGIKIGDVHQESVVNKNLNNTPLAKLVSENKVLKEGEQSEVIFSLQNISVLSAFQLELEFDPDKVDLLGIEGITCQLETSQVNTFELGSGSLIISWTDPLGVDINNEAGIFKLYLKAKENCHLQECIKIMENRIPAEAYGDNSVHVLNLEFHLPSRQISKLTLEQNIPNPWNSISTIAYSSEEAQDICFSIFDLNGKLLYREIRRADAGKNEIILSADAINSSGLLVYELRTESQSLRNKMILIK